VIHEHLRRRLLPVAILVGLLIGTGVPVTYYGLEVMRLGRDATASAAGLAERVLTVVQETPEIWKYQDHRLAEVFYEALGSEQIAAVRLLDVTGNPVLATGKPAGHGRWWTRGAPLVGSAPLVFDGAAIGTVEVSRSREALLLNTLTLLAVCVAGGLGLAVLLYLLPVRVVTGMEARLAEAFGELERTNAELRERDREARAAYEQLARMQDQLVQARKMEAIGQLAGGIAHNFNNLLTVIMGRAEIVLGRLDRANPLWRQVDVISQTAARAAQLTRQILAFGRKQILRPTVVDLGAIATGLEKLLRPLLPESIDLVVSAPETPSRVRVDEAQLEQVIINLVVNARDAMPGGGRLTIAVVNVDLDESFVATHPDITAGAHVRLAVEDTGGGMDAATRAHVFEPFFTTKDPGAGTGLGLATVHGTVKQSGGAVYVESERGRGTTFTIYLPRISEEAVDALPDARATVWGSETVLVVEDEDDVRELTRETLESHGYHVVIARHAGEALEAIARHDGPIHLLLTDVVMPGVDGRELSAQMARARPESKVLYMSGHSDTALGAGLGLPAPLLTKPFTMSALARKVREVLDEAAAGRP
jgi:signal transduction histidine kinase